MCIFWEMHRYGDTPEAPAVHGGDPDLNALLFEAIDRVASRRSREALIARALAAAGASELPADIILLLQFVTGPLRRAATGALGADAAGALVSDVQPLLERVKLIRSSAPPRSSVPPPSSRKMETLPPSGLFRETRARAKSSSASSNRSAPPPSDRTKHGTLPYSEVFRAGKYVLLVDDDVSFLRGLSRLMRAAGMDVVTAPDGGTALRICEKVRPALVITDLDMPKPNGLELAAEIIARLGQLAPPIVLLTGATDVPGAKPGITKVVTKSIRPAELLEAVQEFLPSAE